ncbi:MAG TPA: DUF5947 family protein [Thermoanaerobaculia bacterium]|nr:DUF5947 family protein [Thermoanaerobaculia bacterium]
MTSLRQFVRPRVVEERCDLCGAGIPAQHRHLADPKARKIACACRACSLLFSGQQSARFRVVPEEVRALPEFKLTDAQWQRLAIPIDLAFFYRSATDERVMAFYPSPAGATESLLSLEAWSDIVAANPVLDAMDADVEALLVNRIARPPRFFIAPIDACYELVGLIRMKWRGFSGGAEVWSAIGDYFQRLEERARA